MRFILLFLLVSCGDCKFGKDYRATITKDGRQTGVECKSGQKGQCGYRLWDCHNGQEYQCVHNVQVIDGCKI